MAIPFSYGFRNLLTRKFTTILTAGGMALVTFVFVAILMLAQGLEQTLVDTGSPDNAIVLRAAADTEVSSAVDRDAAAIVTVQPEVEQTSRGEPITSKEALVLVTLQKKSGNKPANVVVRGTGPLSMRLRPQVQMIAGRPPNPGSREVMAGKSIHDSVQGTSIGDTVHFALAQWTVVGEFDAGKTAFNSELWVDADQLMAAFRRTVFSAIILKAPGRQAFDDLKRRLESDPRLSVQVKREIDFYREQSEMMATFIRILGLAMTVFFSIGAILGAMVTMYTAVANRTREIGTLRALGFTRIDIMASFLVESLILGTVGGLVGVAAGSILQIMTISTTNWQTFSELAFGFTITPEIALFGLGFALVMGFLGGLLPAWTAARLTIVDSLRAE
jgi:putative ABC transport system permease protein